MKSLLINSDTELCKNLVEEVDANHPLGINMEICYIAD